MLRVATSGEVAAEIAKRVDLPRVVRPGGPRLSLADRRYFEKQGRTPRANAVATCPRCEAIGLVSPGIYYSDAHVEWRRGSEVWHDGPGLDELYSTVSGCGYDAAPKKAAAR